MAPEYCIIFLLLDILTPLVTNPERISALASRSRPLEHLVLASMRDLDD